MKWWIDKFIPFMLGAGAALLVFVGMATLTAALLREFVDIMRSMFG